MERGHGTLTAGKEITTNATRSPSLTNLTAANEVLNSQTWLPTTLFLGKGGFDVSARGDVLLGPVGNPFLLPQGINNTFWYKTYFSTYAPDSYVNVSSLAETSPSGRGLRPGASSPRCSSMGGSPAPAEFQLGVVLPAVATPRGE